MGPSGAGGTRSPPATPHRLPVGPKMADGVWKGVQSKVIGRSRQLLLNKFSDPSTPCISTNQRPGNPKWPPGAPKWPTGSGKGSNPGRSCQLLLNKFTDSSTPCISTNQRPRNPKWPPGAHNKFFDRSTPSMRKVDDGKKKKR